MTNQFKKGQRVYEIASWDDKGKFYVREWIVDSAGAKRMTFRAADGSMRKHRIGSEFAHLRIFDADRTDPEAKAIELAAAFIARRAEQIEYSLNRAIEEWGNKEGDGYVYSMAHDLNYFRYYAKPEYIADPYQK